MSEELQCIYVKLKKTIFNIISNLSIYTNLLFDIIKAKK
jgi:hypothetical protein